ncbi:CBS domain-containing protein [Loktanella sp. IMCC34160]|uniref:CBS domain-containing protein n=1 Tax=Loktanella sp. IMCC34160 TaxID=2510646 RepID=UPI00101CBDEA|nr:CBS domain-containing protein [Loktanella sp. IMCC34160]RYG92049.1 CBS domain-containing protein [Loktanella sp. IMCC34160]
MLVQQILKAKANAGILSVTPDSSVQDALKVMSDNRVGTVVVSKDGKSLDGILSERDVVREVGQRGAPVLQDPVSAIMTAKIITASEDQTALAILRVMTEKRFRHMPVMRDGEMVGLISIGDVVKGRLEELAMERNALEGMIMGH